MYVCVHACMYGMMDGWMDGLMDGWTTRNQHTYTPYPPLTIYSELQKDLGLLVLRFPYTIP